MPTWPWSLVILEWLEVLYIQSKNYGAILKSQKLLMIFVSWFPSLCYLPSLSSSRSSSNIMSHCFYTISPLSKILKENVQIISPLMMQAENIIFIKFLVLTLSSGFSPLMVNQENLLEMALAGIKSSSKILLPYKFSLKSEYHHPTMTQNLIFIKKTKTRESEICTYKWIFPSYDNC